MPRAWFGQFSVYILSKVFFACLANYSLFVHKSSNGIVVLLIYVDNMLVTSSHASLVSQFLDKLKVEFAVMDLGDVDYFLGVEINTVQTGLFLS